MNELQSHLQKNWIKIRKLVQAGKLMDAAGDANESCDVFKFGPCSECPAFEDKVCGEGRSGLVGRFVIACMQKKTGAALEFAEGIIDWTAKEES